MSLSLKLLSFRVFVLLSSLFVVFLASAVYLGEVDVPSELGSALSSIREDFGSRTGIFSSSIEGMGEASDGLDNPERSQSLVLDFDSSVSTSLFRTWGALTLRGGSALPYLILNSTLWDGDRLVETTRYMMIEVEPGKSRDFDICESCHLSPERSYSCLLEIEEPAELFVSERRVCRVVKDDPLVAIWEDSGAAYGRAEVSENSEKGPVDPISPGSVKSSASPSSKPTAESQGVEGPSEEFEFGGEARSRDAGIGEQKTEDESFPEKEIPDSSSISGFDDGVLDTASHRPSAEDLASSPELEEPEFEGGTDYEGYYVGSTTSNKYHRPDCSYAKKIKPENRIIFSDVWEARGAGYSPCKVCNSE